MDDGTFGSRLSQVTLGEEKVLSEIGLLDNGIVYETDSMYTSQDEVFYNFRG